MSKNLVIVESPAKAKTIAKFLGKDFKVEASIGHIRDLPSKADEIPEEYKKEKWARLGVDINNDFKPLYIIPESKKKQVKKLKDAIKGVENLYLATDEDREGESISWHLLQILKPKMNPKRMVFHEITKDAINKALKNPREVDMNLVHAQEARRILDRLYGYEISPVLWRKIAPKLSAGRVQSVAIRLVVERERSRLKFIPAQYFDLTGLFSTTKQEDFLAELKQVNGKKLVIGKDFDPETGKLNDKKKLQLNKSEADKLQEAILKNNFKVIDLDQKPIIRKPEAPFVTSTLQQEAARKLRYSARRTMQIAQKLYENGYITYMRTDSTTLSETAIKSARDLILNHYGKDYLPEKPQVYLNKVKNAQEAHEAIRPAGLNFRLPENLKKDLNTEEGNLYELIWKRTIASQMNQAKLRSTIAQISDGKNIFHASGKEILFPGFLKVYVEGADDPEEELENQEKFLPILELNQKVNLKDLEVKGHETKPVARYTEASLIKELEKKGIGRPSTYATIMDTIVRREYICRQGNTLVPAFIAFAVVGMMEKYFKHLVDYGFTAEMEEHLDEVANGKEHELPYLKAFYFGKNKQPGLEKLINQDIDAKEMCTLKIHKPDTDKTYTIRVGRFGPYLEFGEQKISIPEEITPSELNDEVIEKLKENLSGQTKSLGVDSETKLPIFSKVGRYGPYIQLGEDKKDKGFKIKSVPKFVDSNDLNLTIIHKILALPKILGQYKDENVIFDCGPYGPYLKFKSQNKSIPADMVTLDLTLEDAIKIIESSGMASGGVIKELGEGIIVKIGRYGPYINNGKTNVAIPKSMAPNNISIDEAKELLAKKLKK